MQIPSIGRIVHYTLTKDDADQINRRRTTSEHIRDRMQPMASPKWPEGAQAHIGNEASEGQVFPMMIVKVDAATVNGQIFLDGNDVLWRQFVEYAETANPGYWSWPVKM